MNIENGQYAKIEERISIFELSGKFLGLNILNAREVIPLPPFTPIPNSNNIYHAVFNLRGEIFPLIDISPILGLPAKQIQAEDMVILVDDSNDIVVGLLIDKIYQILPYSSVDLKPTKGAVARSMEGYLKGILYHNNNLIHVLDLASLFRTKQMQTHY